MTPKLYYADLSPAVRASLLTIKALGIEVDLKPVNMMAGEHLTPDYLKMNPFHTVPTLEDGDFVIWDSHAINAYLVGKYGKDDALYPKDLKKRAIVDQRMYFDCGIPISQSIRHRGVVVKRRRENDWKRQGRCAYPRLVTNNLFIVRQIIECLKKGMSYMSYTFLETLLERNTYVAGESLTLADLSIVATVSSANALVPIPSNRFPKITDWLSRMQALPYYGEANQTGLDKFVGMVKKQTSLIIMAPIIYGSSFSPPVRSVYLTAKALGIELELKEVNTFKGDHLTPEYLKLNPLHTIPTLQDGDFVIYDSHVINAYLVGKYGKDDSLYPKDLQRRAVVDQRMYFECGILFARLRTTVFPIIRQGAKAISKENAAQITEGKNGLSTYRGNTRSVVLTLNALGLEFEYILVDLLVGEQLKPEFLKLNPLHTIPTLQDDDFVIWDSHAINIYLAQKYGKDDSFLSYRRSKKGGGP
ncbi:hypothetical protein NQ317_019156 [Molorchus minor]|uniref:Uncharacterized protein n=1 Tax=Molorchus minor TaxID=1323400 RepID=A0ABQ9JMW3_9CUCU|nr:hypothetical protein NQ317_019156 [Molorchus minor]